MRQRSIPSFSRGMLMVHSPRPFDFCERVDLTAVNRRMIESLIKAGAFDYMGGTRSQLFGAIDTAMESGARAQRDKASGQTGLFAMAFGDTGEKHEHSLPEAARLDRSGQTRRRKGDARLLRNRASAGRVQRQGLRNLALTTATVWTRARSNVAPMWSCAG